jgi:hypothetical protein
MSRSFELFCGVWSRKSEQKAISATLSQVESGPAGRSRSRGWWHPDALHRMRWLPLILTNKNAYIRCKGEELCSNPANWQWGTSVSVEHHYLEWYVAGISHLEGGGGGALCFNFTVQRTCFVTLKIRCNKLTPVVTNLTRGRYRAHHYASSLLRVK